MLNFSIPIEKKIGVNEGGIKWPSLLTPAIPEKKLSAPLNVKSVPQWINQELAKRKQSLRDDVSEWSEVETQNDSVTSTDSDWGTKLPILNFVHFSALMSTYVCLTANIKPNDEALDKLGPDVSKLIRKFIAPLSLYGKVIRDSGDDSLVIKFRVPHEALTPGADLSAMGNLLDEHHIPYVNPLRFQDATEEQPYHSMGQPAVADSVATVCFTIPTKYCVPVVQRILEKAELMEAVQNSVMSGQVGCALQVVSSFLDSSTRDEWKMTSRVEASSMYAFRAHLNFQLGAFKNAIKDSNRAIEFDPTQVEGYAVAIKSYIALGYNELAECVSSEAHCKVEYLTTRFIRGTLLCNIVSAFQRWRTDVSGAKIRLEVLPLSAAVRFSACRYNKVHSNTDEVSVAFSSTDQRHAVLDSYLTHPLKHPNHPGLTVGSLVDLDTAGVNGFPDSSKATATWINSVYSSSLSLIASELPNFCTTPMFYTCRVNRIHATRAFKPKSQIFEEKVSLLLPVLGSSSTRIRIEGNTVIRPGEAIICCNYCGGIIQTDSTTRVGGSGSPTERGSTTSIPYVVCSLGCGTTYCSEGCRDRAASENHWMECTRSIFLNIGPVYGIEGNWTAASFAIRRVFLGFEHFISSLVPEVKLTKRGPNAQSDEKPDPMCALAISMRLYKQIVACILSFVLWPLLGVHPMPSSMEDLVNFQSSKLENLLKELESKKITPGRSVDRYHILLAEKILHALDIPFLVDGNYSATPTVAEELCLCPSSSLIPQISKRDLKFGSDQPSYKSDIEGDVKSACAAAIWTFSQSISVAIRETLGNAPLPTQPGSPFSDGQPTNAWNCSSFLSFLGASRFVPQLWDFCCTGYCIAEATLASNTEPRWRDQGMGEVFVPVVIISPHLSIITDLGEFAGNYAYSRYCFENEIRLKTLRQCADESMMSMRSFNDSDNGDLSITSDAPHVSDPYDPSPWIQWCSSIAAGCTNIDTPTVSLDQSGQHHRHVVVTSSGPVKLDDMVRLRSAWSCI